MTDTFEELPKIDSQWLFDVFWRLYPRKVGKKNALRAWGKIDLREATAIFENVRIMSESENWRKNNGQYIPHPSTYLNGERWKDELPQSAELNISTPQTEEEVYIALLFNEFGIKTHLTNNKNLVEYYRSNSRLINDIKTYSCGIIKDLCIISRMKAERAEKGFANGLRNIAYDFGYWSQRYEEEERKKRCRNYF